MSPTPTEERIVDIVAASRPAPESVEAWTPSRSSQVLTRVLADARSAAPSPSGRSTATRRWTLIAASAIAVVAVVIAVPLTVPSTSPVAPVPAAAADHLLASVKNLPTLPSGSFAQTVISSDPYSHAMGRSSTATYWRNNGELLWASKKGRGLIMQLSRDTYVTLQDQDVPSDPQAIRQAFLHGTGSEGTTKDDDNAVFEAAAEWLATSVTSGTTRTAIITMMSGLSHTVIADGATDPLGRSAITVTHSGQRATLGSGSPLWMTTSVYFDPQDSQVLAMTMTGPDGVVERRDIVTDRRVTTAVPTEVTDRVGTSLEAKYQRRTVTGLLTEPHHWSTTTDLQHR